MKKLWVNLILSSCAIASFLLIAELALRLSGYGVEYSERMEAYEKYDPETGWSLRADIDKLPTNNFGFRAPKNFPREKTPGVTRVALLGDSGIFGHKLPYESTFGAILEQNPNIETLNFGVSGYGTDQALIRYRRKASKFHSDYVCIGISLCNDVINNYYNQQYGYSKPMFQLVNGEPILTDHPVSYFWHNIDHTLRKTSRLYNTARAAYINSKTHAQIDRFSHNSNDKNYLEALHLTIALLYTFAEEVIRDKAIPIFLILPYKDIYRKNNLNHPFYKAIIKLAREKHIAIIDGVKLIGDISNPGEKAFVDRWHLNKVGSYIIADRLFQMITSPQEQRSRSGDN